MLVKMIKYLVYRFLCIPQVLLTMAPRNSMYVTFAVVPSSCYVFLFDDITFFFFFFCASFVLSCVLRFAPALSDGDEGVGRKPAEGGS